MRKLSSIVVLAAAATGCVGFEHKSDLAGPSAAGVNALLGTWSSTDLIPSPASCSNFKWNATEKTSTSAKGSFSATCSGDLQFVGTAEGSFAPGTSSVINWQATATASAPGLTNCSMALTGTGELGVDSIRIPYEGTTCLGKVSGVQTLKK